MRRPSAGASERTSCDVLAVEDLGQQRLPARGLAAVLRQAGFDVQLADLGPVTADGAADLQAIIALAGRLQPRLVLFSILFASRVPEYLSLADALRSAGVQAHISITGPLPSFAPAELLAACSALDSVLCGEAETSVAELAARLDDAARWPAVPGLACRGQNGGIRVADDWPAPLADLDRLPFPEHDGELPAYRGDGFATVEGSRGCYHACNFCLPTAFYRASARGAGVTAHYRLRSVDNLVDEIEALHRRGARLFLFDDEQFLPPEPLRSGRIALIQRELTRRRLEIAFTIKCRADDVEAGLFRQLREMGLLRVYVGIESGCPASLDLFGKGVTTKRNLAALATLDELGIVADFYDLIFHPWSTLETVAADIAFCRRAASHISTALRFGEVGVLPGTRLAVRLREEGRCCGEPWSYSYDLTDPRLEVLRRMSRFVFAASGRRRCIEQVTEAWYAILLEQRFRPSRREAALAGRLREAVSHLNRDWLAVWSEMLEFAQVGRILEGGPVNDAAGRWAERVNTACLHAADIFAELGLPGHASTEVAPLC